MMGVATSRGQVMGQVGGNLASLDAAGARLAALLHWPGNLGVEFQPLHLSPAARPTPTLVYLQGLVDEEWLRRTVIAPLKQAGIDTASPDQLRAAVTAPRVRLLRQMRAVAQGVAQGGVALLLPGAGAALLVDGGRAAAPGAAAPALIPGSGWWGGFVPELLENVARLRRQWRTPDLRAEPLSLPAGDGGAGLIYLQDRADPQVLARVREWSLGPREAESLRRGGAVPAARWWRVPHLMRVPSPEKVGALLGAGYVAVLVEGVAHAYVAPVTVGALLSAPADEKRAGFWEGLLRLVRLVLLGVVLLGPAAVVALLSYHQEMMPTSFLLILASTRENAAFSILQEVPMLELLQDLIRAAGGRRWERVLPGGTLVAGVVAILIAVETGLVGPVPALISILGALAALALPATELLLLARVWRYELIMAAGFLGFYGVAGVLFLLISHLTQLESFGVPFAEGLGPGSGPVRRRGGWRGGPYRVQGRRLQQ